LLALGIGPGDEVIVPALTHVATAMAVLQVGATPCFVDVDPVTWTISRTAVEAAVGPHTRAVIAVHLCGVPADVLDIATFARKRGLVVIEDAAQANGSRFAGRPLGSMGDAGCLSFQSTKTISTGEGGVVLLHDAEFARRARLAMNLGEHTIEGAPTIDLPRFDAAAPLEYDQVGWNHRMSALQAALGLAQLDHFARRAAKLEAARARLVAAFEGHPLLRFQGAPTAAEVVSGTVFFEVLPPLARDELARRLRLERIDLRLPYQRPLSDHTVFRAARCASPLETTRHICNSALGVRIDADFRPGDLRSIERALERAAR
jgi:dTDP-4-amino-4,6-dideoxygalactose transaminase